ncbi:hypothetical protein B4158_5687 [Bacillus cereus]|nr:hypothetical protein B4158_5687 [Bacillus cereus]
MLKGYIEGASALYPQFHLYYAKVRKTGEELHNEAPFSKKRF